MDRTVWTIPPLTHGPSQPSQHSRRRAMGTNGSKRPPACRAWPRTIPRGSSPPGNGGWCGHFLVGKVWEIDGNRWEITGTWWTYMENIWEYMGTYWETDDNPLDSGPPISDTAMFLPCLMWTFQIQAMTFWGLNDPTFGCATVSAVVTIKDIGKSSGSLVDVFPPWWFEDLILNIYNPFNIWVAMKMIKWSFCCCNSGPMPAVTFGGSTTMIRTLLHSQPCHAMGMMSAPFCGLCHILRVNLKNVVQAPFDEI